MWIAIAYQLSFERNYALELREAENDNLARLFEEHVQRTLAAPSVTLKQLEAEYRQHGKRLDLAQYWRDRLDELTSYSILSVVEEDGNLILASIPFVKPQNFRNVENFQFHMRDASPNVFIAKPRLGTVTGRPTIYLTRRMNKADGTFGGYTLVGIDPQYFSSFYDQIDLGPDSVVVLVGRDGVIRARRSDAPLPGTVVDQDMRSTALFTVHLKQAEHGKFRATSPIDGVMRLYSYRSTKAYPLVLMVGTSEAATLARFEERKKIYLWTAGVASVLIFAFAALVMIQMSREARVIEELRTSEERYALVERATSDVIWDRNLQSGEAYLSPRGEELLGCRQDELQVDEAPFFERVHPDDDARVREALAQSARDGAPYRVEYRLRNQDGGHRWVLLRGKVVRNEKGEPARMVGSIADITERKRAEVEHAQLAAIVESSNDAILTRGPDRTILSWNAAAERLFGWSAQEAVGQSIDLIVPPERPGVLQRFIECAERGEPMRPVATTHLRKDGVRIPTQITVSPVRDKQGNVIAHSFTVRDMTEFKRGEEALRNYAARMRELSQRLQEVGESERRAISRELHDRIGQGLTTLGLMVGVLDTRLSRESRSAVQTLLKDMQTLLRYVVAHVRDIMAELRPAVLDDYGLLAALRHLVTELANRTGIAVNLGGIDPCPRLPLIVETAMFRISQEALNNIAKHAHAKKVEISLNPASERVVLDIADDGVGFDTSNRLHGGKHWGVITMRERAEAAGIMFRLESAPGTGTRIVLEVERAAT